MRVGLLVAAALITVGVAYGQDKYEEKCTITTGSGVSVDSCDARQFLYCQVGYCRCSNPATQLYDYRYAEQTSRTRRSPKKGSKGGSFKKVSKGGGFKKGVGTRTIGGGTVGHGGWHGGSTVINVGSSTRYLSSESRSKKKEYSCYGRVGSQCVFSYKNFNIATVGTTTTAPATKAIGNETTTASSNVTTTESSFTAATHSVSALTDISKIPKCVRDAVCQRPSVGPASNATATGTDRHVVQVDGDPRLGVCTCASGYVASKTGQCIKLMRSGASNLSLGFSVIVFALVSKLIN